MIDEGTKRKPKIRKIWIFKNRQRLNLVELYDHGSENGALMFTQVSTVLK